MNQINFPRIKSSNEILTSGCIKFLTELSNKFESCRKNLILLRIMRQISVNEGKYPDFYQSTEVIRNGDWKVSSIPDKLKDRTIEITGPVDRKMIVNGLNSEANGYMADFEDSTSPTWDNIINGQINLRDAVQNKIELITSTKKYKLRDNIANLATLLVRPRGLHLNEKNFKINGKEISASLFDFGVYFYTNAQKLASLNIGPYFYLPKLQNHLEARLWNDIFVFSQEYLNIPKGTVKATVLIEHILAAFEMDEILYELREHSAGLNCGRWDYIFSYIKTFHQHMVLPDKSLITMNTHFMNSYVKLLVQTCHKRGVCAMGGMAAQVPVKNNRKLNEYNLNKVYLDKLNEAKLGLDGTWVAHPGLIEVAKLGFEKYKPKEQPNQIDIPREHVEITKEDLLKVPSGEITLSCIEDNVSTCLEYLDNWVKGIGCVAINHKMEDLATAEISRIQLWNWLQHGKVDKGDLLQLIDNEKGVGKESKDILKKVTLNTELTEFISLEAYPYLDQNHAPSGLITK